VDITNNLKKIEKALDLRFERDSTLYISKKDTEHVKESLYHSRFQNINAYSKKFGNKIIGKIIINNNWLLDFNKNKKNLKRLFDNIDKNFLTTISKDVIEDKVFSTAEFKLFIKQYFLAAINIKECSKIYKNDKELIQNRVTCFKRFLKEEYLIENPPNYVVRFIDMEFKNCPKIYDYIQFHDANFLSDVFEEFNDLSDIVKWVIENKITDKKDRVWNKLLYLNKDLSLEKIVNYISDYPDWDNKITKYLIQKRLAKFKELDNFSENVIELYYNYSSIRLLFIHMIEPPKFENKELANSLLDEFEQIGLPNKSENSINNIRNWSESDEGFNNKDILIEEINIGHDLTNFKTLNYFYFKLNKTKKDVILDVYDSYQYDENLKQVISYYLARIMERNNLSQHFQRINSSEYVERIVYFLEKLNINTKYSKKFLEENQEYNLLNKFNRR